MASYPGRSQEGGAFERAVGEMSTQADVGRSPNYQFIPPAPHAEPVGRP